MVEIEEEYEYGVNVVDQVFDFVEDSETEKTIEISDPMVCCPCCCGLGYLEESEAKNISKIP